MRANKKQIDELVHERFAERLTAMKNKFEHELKIRVMDERKRCAKIANEWTDWDSCGCGGAIAVAIKRPPAIGRSNCNIACGDLIYFDNIDSI